MKKKNYLCLLCIVTLLCISGCIRKDTDSGVFDENYVMKAFCLYDLYEYPYQDGSIKIFLDGNNDNTRISGNEMLETSLYPLSNVENMCEEKEAEMEAKLQGTASCDSDTRTATNGMAINAYTLTYEYKTRENMNDIVFELENDGYDCLIILDEDTEEKNKNIVGKWVNINDAEEYFVFNDDGTGVYNYGKYVSEEFYYSYDGIDTITYTYRTYILNLRYDDEEQIFYKINESFYKEY